MTLTFHVLTFFHHREDSARRIEDKAAVVLYKKQIQGFYLSAVICGGSQEVR